MGKRFIDARCAVNAHYQPDAMVSCQKLATRPSQLAVEYIVLRSRHTYSFSLSFIFLHFAMSDSIIHVTDASFESDVLKADLPVLVDYWAAWCGPCKMIAPLLDEAAELYQGRVIIAKLNVDENPDTPAQFGVRGIPTLMLFKDGKVAQTKVGALSKSQLSAFLDSSL